MSVPGRHRPQRPGPKTVAPSVAAQSFRPDIQGLRALAVGLVVAYHLYPHALPGGYVGVDVFFVISGFLITSHLANRFARTGRVRMLEFYGRRARRLLPAAVFVLVVTWFVGRQVLPTTQLDEAAREIRASALYVQNWVLSHNAVDYLKSDQTASPVQHYWSLSVEEQFYLVWPLIFLAGWLVAALLGRRVGAAARSSDEEVARAARATGLKIAGVLAVAIIAGSLWYSIHETARNPAAAYFITTTRLWELGLGGLLALMYEPITRVLGRFGLGAWAGLGMIAWSAVALSGASAFPGWIALVPTLGAALMITCGSTTGRLGTAAIFTRRPLVFVGDISYSLYLWHWPIIVLWLGYHGGKIGYLDGPAVVVLSVLAAWLTKIVIEDPIRRAQFIAKFPARSMATALVAAVPVVLSTMYIASEPGPFHGKPGGSHPGAVALASPSTVTHTSASIIPPVPEVPADAAFANQPGCKAGTFDTKVVTCTKGDTTDPVATIALIGDSFAGEWSSALEQIANEQHWKLVTVTHDTCPWTATTLVRSGTTTPFTQCATWGRAALNYLVHDLKPDVTIVSFHPSAGVPSHPQYDSVSQAQIEQGMVQYWRQVSAAGSFVVGLDHTPDPGIDIPSCLSSHTGSVAKCTTPSSKAVSKDPSIKQAVQALGTSKAAYIDMTPYICTSTKCPPVVGGVVVYRDVKHLTKTFTLSMVPYLRAKLLAVPALAPAPKPAKGLH